MDSELVISPELSIQTSEFTWRFSRSSGPGGQGVNTTDSRVELSWNPFVSEAVTRLSPTIRERLLANLAPRLVDDTIRIAASQYRSQLRNRQAAQNRLAALIRDGIAPPAPPRRPTRLSRGAKERRLQSKRFRSQTKANRSKVRRDPDG